MGPSESEREGGSVEIGYARDTEKAAAVRPDASKLCCQVWRECDEGLTLLKSFFCGRWQPWRALGGSR